MQIMTQLALCGQCRQAFEQYVNVLGDQITVMNTFGDHDAALAPGSTAASAEHIRFAELKVGDSAILDNDVAKNEFVPMRGFHIALDVTTKAEVQRILAAFSDGGQAETVLNEAAWSSAFPLVTDQFGTPWLILSMDQ